MEEEELKGDPDREKGLHDHDIEWLQWVDWIDIIQELVTKKDYYQKKYMKLDEGLEELIKKLFYIDNIKPIKSCNWREGTNWMERYTTLRRKPSHPGTATLTPTQENNIKQLEPKVKDKISLITKFINT